jgi:hypothetical protein
MSSDCSEMKSNIYLHYFQSIRKKNNNKQKTNERKCEQPERNKDHK